MHKNGGYMLIQLIIGIMIIVVIASIVALDLSSFSENQKINNASDDIAALFDEARSRTIAGDAGLTYGVHLASDRAVLFSGTAYAGDGVGTETVYLPPTIEIDSIMLAEGGSDVVFTMLTGETEDTGTFIVRRVATATEEKTMTVDGSGLVDGE